MTWLLCGAAACEDGGAGAGDDAPADEADAAASPIDAASADATPSPPDATPLPPPPSTWQEHWFEHDQLVELVYYDDVVAIYFDADVERAGTEWLLPFLSDLWKHTTATYGDFGGDRLYSIHHQGRYSGGHPSTYFDASHDFRNVTDCGPGPWQSGVDLPSHEIAHVVEIANNGAHGSPGFGIWGDSKWAEFYQYDAYVALGMDADAQRVFDRFTAASDDFPRPGTFWFRDWYYPLWRDYGHAAVMVRFFELLAEHFPRSGVDYARGLNWGEYVHFMSGAAGVDLKPLATDAFGWPDERETQFQQARADFPAITY